VKPIPTIVFVLAVVAVVLVVILAGWANDKAKPGSRGRGQVTRTQTEHP
jgi:hypothetical protein